MSRQAERLRKLFSGSDIARVIGAHDALGAKLAEQSGFNAVWSSGLEISTSFAVPDANILTMFEFLSAAQSMVDASPLPVIADCDTGFGNSNNVIRLVQKFEAAGVAAVCIEDKLFPKVNSFVPGRQELATTAEFVGKIMAAKNAQRSPAFMIIARIEALICGLGQEEALRRAHAYAAAGADAILIHSSSKSPQEIIQFARAWDFSAPLVVVPTTYYAITAKQLEELRIKAVIYANHGIRASIKATLDVYREILETGSSASVESRIAPMDLVFQLQGMPQLKRDEQAYLRTGEIATRAIIPAAGDHLSECSMKHIAADIPMAMLDINGKPLLRRQVEILKAAGVKDITVVGGYRRESIAVDGVRVVDNPDWAATGEMHSIARAGAGHPFRGRTLVAYSDILFDLEVCRKLLAREEDIVVVADCTYSPETYSFQRKRIDLMAVSKPPPSNGQRMLKSGPQNRVVRIGKELAPSEAHCEFTGLALFSERGWDLLNRCDQQLRERFRSGPFHEAACFEKASLTDMLQELIERGQPVHCVETWAGWTEIHSFEDYKLVCCLTAPGT